MAFEGHAVNSDPALFGVPFYNLRKLSKLLQENEPGYLQPIRRSYLAVLWDMINAEPKVPHGTPAGAS